MKFKLQPGINHVMVPVTVNGEGPYDFVIDTGATATSINRQLAEHLRFDPVPDSDGRWSVVSLEYKLAGLKSMDIGGERFVDQEVLVIDFADKLCVYDSQFGGVIGHNTLKDFVMSIDYPQGTLQLERTPNGVEKWLDFKYIDGTHLVGVPVHIDEEGPYDFVLDTGAGGTVMSAEFAEQLQLTSQSVPVVCRGMGGDVPGRLAHLERVSIGHVSYDGASVLVLDLKGVSPRGGAIKTGIIGYPFLRDYRLVIDYPGKRFALEN
jgi:predicted aspartyl protease